MRETITIQEGEVLLERYYEGFTSVKEEKLLHTFLSQKDLPERFDADQAILNYLDTQKKKSKIKIIPLWSWASAAASVLIGITLVHFLLSEKSDSYAYIDGKKITNMEQVKEQALASLQAWNTDNPANLNTDDIIIQQLQLFAK